METLKPQSNGQLYSNIVIGMAYDGWAVTFWYSEEGPGRAASLPSSLFAVPNVTAINNQFSNFMLFDVAYHVGA